MRGLALVAVRAWALAFTALAAREVELCSLAAVCLGGASWESMSRAHCVPPTPKAMAPATLAPMAREANRISTMPSPMPSCASAMKLTSTMMAYFRKRPMPEPVAPPTMRATKLARNTPAITVTAAVSTRPPSSSIAPKASSSALMPSTSIAAARPSTTITI